MLGKHHQELAFGRCLLSTCSYEVTGPHWHDRTCRAVMDGRDQPQAPATGCWDSGAGLTLSARKSKWGN